MSDIDYDYRNELAELMHPELRTGNEGYEYVWHGPDFLCSNCYRPRSEHPDGWGMDTWRRWRHEFRSTGLTEDPR